LVGTTKAAGGFGFFGFFGFGGRTGDEPEAKALDAKATSTRADRMVFRIMF
jgi:hypothetical protein